MSKSKTTFKDIHGITDLLRHELPRLRQQYGVSSLGLFGSYVRGQQRPKSDIDILVDFSEVPGMLRFLDLERELSKMLGLPVDLVQKDALKPAIGRRIKEEVLTI
jgi:predicted nucleotidyltransferase